MANVLHLYPENDVGERPWNRSGGFNKLARNRRGITLDLGQTKAHALFKKLAATSDVVLENYSPRLMGQFGLDLTNCASSIRRSSPPPCRATDAADPTETGSPSAR